MASPNVMTAETIDTGPVAHHRYPLVSYSRTTVGGLLEWARPAGGTARHFGRFVSSGTAHAERPDPAGWAREATGRGNLTSTFALCGPNYPSADL